MSIKRLNDDERRQWINNDEGLYNWQRSSRLSMRAFIRENHAELDEYIHRALGIDADAPAIRGQRYFA
jgi:hypothetical protein